jgi:GntR family transcriptional regulator/MocR family aminotransferase
MSRSSQQISLPFLRIDRKSARPVYEQLYLGMREAILSGRLRPNDRLPATRLIAEELGISRNIVVMAFEQLLMEGYIRSKSGAGSYVEAMETMELTPPETVQTGAHTVTRKVSAGFRGGKERPARVRPMDGDLARRLQELVLQRNIDREETLPFQTSQPAFDVFPFAVWSRLAGRAYRYLDFQHLGYEDAAGHLPLREAIADHLRINRGVQCDASRILIVNGTQQALFLAAQLLMQPGDRFWIDDPGYVNARSAFLLHGAVACPIPVTSDGTDIDFACRHYPDAKLAYLTPSHQHPLGGTLPLAQRLKLLAWAHERRLWIIEDDYDSELRYRGKPIPSLQGLDTRGNVIYIGTFSKVLFPALRIAYMVLPDAASFQSFRSLKALNDRQSALIDQLVLTDFIKEGYFHRHLRKMRSVYSLRLQCLLEELKEHLSEYLYFSDPAAGMHLAAYFKKSVDEDKLIQLASRKGLIILSLREYTIGPCRRPGVLLGYSSFSEDIIRQAVQTLKSIFRQIS